MKKMIHSPYICYIIAAEEKGESETFNYMYLSCNYKTVPYIVIVCIAMCIHK